MPEVYWYYIKDNKQEGPIPENKIKEMFETGQLDLETLVWSEPMKEWTPASKVESFRAKIIPSPPILTQKPPPIPDLKKQEGVNSNKILKMRAEIRFFARLFDYFLFSFVVGLVFSFCIYFCGIDPSILPRPGIFLGMLIMFFWVFIEAFLLSAFGTTPGKWLLKITVRDLAGNKPTFYNALNRSLSVWINGLGIGFPLIQLITLLVAYRNFLKKGSTTWDSNSGFKVTYDKIGAVRTIVAILFFLSIFLLYALEKAFKSSI